MFSKYCWDYLRVPLNEPKYFGALLRIRSNTGKAQTQEKCRDIARGWSNHSSGLPWGRNSGKFEAASRTNESLNGEVPCYHSLEIAKVFLKARFWSLHEPTILLWKDRQKTPGNYAALCSSSSLCTFHSTRAGIADLNPKSLGWLMGSINPSCHYQFQEVPANFLINLWDRTDLRRVWHLQVVVRCSEPQDWGLFPTCAQELAFIWRLTKSEPTSTTMPWMKTIANASPLVFSKGSLKDSKGKW